MTRYKSTLSTLSVVNSLVPPKNLGNIFRGHPLTSSLGVEEGLGPALNTPPLGRTMRATHVVLLSGAFSCLLALSLAVAMQASGAEADELQAGPASVRNTDAARPRVNQRHLLSFHSRRRVHEGTALRAIATKDTPATDQAMAATPTTCDKCQWQ